MKRTRIKIKVCLLLCMSFMLFICNACTSEEEYTQYQNAFTEFQTTFNQYNNTIKSIDANSTDANTQLLAQLEVLNSSFAKLAEVPVPKRFAEAETLTDEAASYMSEATELYRNALTAETYDAFTISMANEKYNKAFECIQSVGVIVNGGEPAVVDSTLPQN